MGKVLGTQVPIAMFNDAHIRSLKQAALPTLGISCKHAVMKVHAALTSAERLRGREAWNKFLNALMCARATSC